MYALTEALEGIRAFMNLGGEVLTLIAILLFVMWTLIFERVWYFKTSLKKEVQGAMDTWEERAERRSKRAHQVREALISRVSMKIDENMPMIKTMVAMAPLFGLLGTVWGMIQVFEVMALQGTSNARSMAAGVSRATVPTMAGMVGALSGVFFVTILTRTAKRNVNFLEDEMTMDH